MNITVVDSGGALVALVENSDPDSDEALAAYQAVLPDGQVAVRTPDDGLDPDEHALNPKTGKRRNLTAAEKRARAEARAAGEAPPPLDLQAMLAEVAQQAAEKAVAAYVEQEQARAQTSRQR